MATTKTKPTGVSVEAFLAAIEDPIRRQDCQIIERLMSKVTGEQARMWGPTIIGYGTYHYKYESGHEGDSCRAGFASRKPDITVYLADFEGRDALLARLGKHKLGKSCLYFRRLADIDIKVLEQLIAGSLADMKRRYG